VYVTPAAHRRHADGHVLATVALQRLALKMSLLKKHYLDRLGVADHGVHPDVPKNVSKSDHGRLTRIVVPTFCHDETAFSWVASRALALTGFPGHRRFTAESLRQAVERAGVTVTRAETLPGLIPMGYVEGTFGQG
jgi:hypothetical protein